MEEEITYIDVTKIRLSVGEAKWMKCNFNITFYAPLDKENDLRVVQVKKEFARAKMDIESVLPSDAVEFDFRKLRRQLEERLRKGTVSDLITAAKAVYDK